MLSDRIYGILKFFSVQTELLMTSETPYTFDELIELRNYGYLKEQSKAYYEFEGACPCMKSAFKITEKGKDAIKLHEKEINSNVESLKISKSALSWTKATFWITTASLVIAIISLLLTILLR